MANPVDLAARADPEFVQLCELLYGESVDYERVWEDVFAKMSPDASDLNTGSRPRKQRDWATGLSRASNAVGITAGGAALLQAAKDPRLAEGGRSSKRIYRAGTAVEEAAKKTKLGAKYYDKVGQKKVAAKLAGGALLLQAGNLAGDALTSRVLARQQKKAVQKGALSRGKAAGQKAVDVTTKHPYKTAAVVGTPIAGATYIGHKRKQARFAQQPVDTFPYPAPYAKRDVTWEGEFSKLDTDKRLAFGWASVTSVDGVPVVDSQADYIHPDDLEDAAYRYVMKSRKGGDMHRRSTDDSGGDVPFHVSDLVESFVLTPEKIEKMGLPSNTQTGWWVGFKFHDDDAWSDIKKGKRTGFSIHGRGHRRDVDYDDVMTGA